MKNHITLTAFTFCMTASCFAQSDEYVRVVCWSDPDFDEVYELCLPPEYENVFKDVAIGHDYTVAIRPDGTLTHWGDCVSGTCYLPKGNYKKLFAGGSGGYAQDENGRLTPFGSFEGAATLDQVDANFVDVEIDDRLNSVGLTDTGELWISGLNPCSDDPIMEPFIMETLVTDFAIDDDGFVVAIEDGGWSTYGYACGGEPYDLSLLNDAYPDVSVVEIHSSASGIFILDQSGTLRSFCQYGFEACIPTPLNISFQSFRSNPWSFTATGVRTNGDVVVLGWGSSPNPPQNWGTPDIQPLSAQISNHHAIALVSTDQPVTFCSTDSNKDGVVDFQDLIELLSSWGPCSG